VRRNSPSIPSLFLSAGHQLTGFVGIPFNFIPLAGTFDGVPRTGWFARATTEELAHRARGLAVPHASRQKKTAAVSFDF
jgi:hypothetical protein